MANRFWVGNAGTWDNTTNTHWSASSGGAGGVSVPGVTDDVFFDANSFSMAGQTVTLDQTPQCKNINFTGVANSPTLNLLAFTLLSVHGNFTGDTFTFTAATSSGAIAMLSGGGTVTFTQNSATLNVGITYQTSPDTGTLVLGGDLVLGAGWGFLVGSGKTFNSAGFDITAAYFNIGSGVSPTTILSGSTLTLKPTTNNTSTFHVQTSGTPIVTSDTTDLIIDLSGLTLNQTAQFTKVNGINLVFHDITVIGQGTDNVNLSFIDVSGVSNSTSFNTFTVQDAPVTIKLAPNLSSFVTQTLDLNGSEDHLITLRSTTDGQQSNLSANTASISYVDVKDNKALGNAIDFDDSVGGVDSGNNINWAFFKQQFNAGTEGRLIIAPNAGTTINGIIDARGISAERSWQGPDDSGRLTINSEASISTTQFDAVTAVLADVTDLSVILDADRNYAFEAGLFIDADAVGGSKFAINCDPAPVSIIYEIVFIDNGTGNNVITSRQVTNAGSAGEVGTTEGFCLIRGSLLTDPNSNDPLITVQFAQNVANGTSSILVGSYFKVKQRV